MSIVQKLDGNQRTFHDVAKTLLKRVLQEASHSDRVDVVFDVYRESSIKDADRVNRGSGSGVRFRNISAGHKIRQWRSFLSEAQNKTMLIEFITEEWKSDESKAMIGDKTLFFACAEQCWRISRVEVFLVDELESSQEEADTRILLHAKHASQNGYKTVIVVSEETVQSVYRNVVVDLNWPCFKYMLVLIYNKNQWPNVLESKGWGSNPVEG